MLYGAGLRLTEALHLHVKDFDFEVNSITVCHGKGAKDRTILLPESLREALRNHLKKVKFIHKKDLKRGFGAVWMPFPLDKKYPNAAKDWKWQYVLAGPPNFRRRAKTALCADITHRRQSFKKLGLRNTAIATPSITILRRSAGKSLRHSHSSGTSRTQRRAADTDLYARFEK